MWASSNQSDFLMPSTLHFHYIENYFLPLLILPDFSSNCSHSLISPKLSGMYSCLTSVLKICFYKDPSKWVQAHYLLCKIKLTWEKTFGYGPMIDNVDRVFLESLAYHWANLLLTQDIPLFFRLNVYRKYKLEYFQILRDRHSFLFDLSIDNSFQFLLLHSFL